MLNGINHHWYTVVLNTFLPGKLTENSNNLGNSYMGEEMNEPIVNWG
jgi:hypothetical protein